MPTFSIMQNDPNRPGRPLILALGDSLTAGYGLLPHQSFAARLQHLLRERRSGAVVHNSGVSGDTTTDALSRLPRVLAGLRQRPDLAVVQLGANDLFRGVPPAVTRANLGTIVEELQRCGIPVLLATMEPPPFLAPFVGDYGGIYADVAARHGIGTVPFFPAGILGHPAMVLADRLHPNAQAIDLCAQGVLPVLLAALGEVAEAA